MSTPVLRCDTKCYQNEILSLCADRLQSRLAAQFTELEGQVQRDRPQGAGSRQEAQDRAWRSSSWSGHAQHGKRSWPDKTISLLDSILTIFSFCQAYGGMRGIKGLVTETSLLDPEEVWPSC